MQVKGIENIFNKAIADESPNPLKKASTHEQESFRTPDRQDCKISFSPCIAVWTLRYRAENIETTEENTKSHRKTSLT